MKKVLMILMAGLAATLFAAGSTAAQDSGMDIHGFISEGYFNSDENYFTDIGEGDDFIFNEVALNFSKELTDDLRIGLQLFSRDFKDASSDEVKIDWAVADYRFQDWLGLRFGQMKMPHGLYNEIRDIDILRNPVFLPDSVYQELTMDLYAHDVFFTLSGINSRDLFLSLQGIGLYGFLDLNALGGISYQLLYGTQKIETGEPRSFEKASSQIFNYLENSSLDVDKKYAGNVIWETPFEGLRLGFSMNNIEMTASARLKDVLPGLGVPGLGAAGEEVTATYNKMENWVASAEFSWENLTIAAECILSNKEYEIDSPQRSKTIEDMPTGFYVGGAYRFADWFELGGYYSKTIGDNDDYYENIADDDILPYPDFFHKFDDIVATMRFDINQYWAFKLEAHKISCEYTAVTPSGRIDPPFLTYTKTEEDWNLYIAKMTVAF